MAFAFTYRDRIPPNPENFMWSPEDKKRKDTGIVVA
jgi:hypothetical protein